MSKVKSKRPGVKAIPAREAKQSQEPLVGFVARSTREGLAQEVQISVTTTGAVSSNGHTTSAALYLGRRFPGIGRSIAYMYCTHSHSQVTKDNPRGRSHGFKHAVDNSGHRC